MIDFIWSYRRLPILRHTTVQPPDDRYMASALIISRKQKFVTNSAFDASPFGSTHDARRTGYEMLNQKCNCFLDFMRRNVHLFVADRTYNKIRHSTT